jgi:hypothetical protein
MNNTTTTIRTVADTRNEKRAADARAEYNDTLRARIERERQEYIQARLREYPQIGILSNGKFYAFVNGVCVEGYFLGKIINAITDAK